MRFSLERTRRVKRASFDLPALVTLLAFVLITPLSSATAAEPASVRARIDRLVQPLLDGQLVEGLIIGVTQPVDAKDRLVDDSGVAYFGYGRSGAKTATTTDPTPTADTLFEIGSITKPFTGLLLADMVEQGEVQLDEPVAKLLPETVKVPSREGREITLVDLATHTSALPRMPKNFAPANSADPYADYTAEKLFEFVSSYELRRTPGKESVYSNLGMGLLGEALALRAKSSYETLLRERIWQPLEMNETRVKLDDSARDKMAAGHDADGVPLANWEFQALAGAGGIRSSARDMVKFLRANLYLPAGANTPGAPAELPKIPDTLRRALALSQTPRHAMKSPPGEIALAWMVPPGGKAIWHNGQTGGFHSFAAFDRSRGTGVVVLSNSAVRAVDDLGERLLQLLAGEEPEPPQVRQIAQVDPAVLKQYVGEYALDTGVGGTSPFTVTFDHNRLWAQLPLQPKAGIYPESESVFFYKMVDAQVTFYKDSTGKVERLVLHQAGRDMEAKLQPAKAAAKE